jgi:SAM-dependent methyltransferase
MTPVYSEPIDNKRHRQFNYDNRDLEQMTAADNYLQWIIDEIIPYLGRSVAEIGAGNGNIAERILSAGVGQLTAVEPAENMYADLQRRFQSKTGCTPLKGYLADVYRRYPSTFDTVVYINVLEHIYDETLELSYARSVLKKGGYLVIFVPALRCLYSQWDLTIGHYRRYSRQALFELAASAGFSCVKMRYFDIAGVIPWLLVYKLMRKRVRGGQVALYDRLVVPVMHRVERALTPPIGKNLLMIAQKR